MMFSSSSHRWMSSLSPLEDGDGSFYRVASDVVQSVSDQPSTCRYARLPTATVYALLHQAPNLWMNYYIVIDSHYVYAYFDLDDAPEGSIDKVKQFITTHSGLSAADIIVMTWDSSGFSARRNRNVRSTHIHTNWVIPLVELARLVSYSCIDGLDACVYRMHGLFRMPWCTKGDDAAGPGGPRYKLPVDDVLPDGWEKYCLLNVWGGVDVSSLPPPPQSQLFLHPPRNRFEVAPSSSTNAAAPMTPEVTDSIMAEIAKFVSSETIHLSISTGIRVVRTKPDIIVLYMDSPRTPMYCLRASKSHRHTRPYFVITPCSISQWCWKCLDPVSHSHLYAISNDNYTDWFK